MNQVFEDAMRTVANTTNAPKYQMWQPLWGRGSSDCRCYLVIGIHRPMFGAWRYDVVLETDPTGPVYGGLEDYFTSEPPKVPALHPEHAGTIHFTSNGRAVKSIEGGFPELARPS